MKAPEKLYLRKRNKLPLEVVRNKWYKTDPQSLYGSVEYTRTDAFIDKAEGWLREVQHGFILTDKDITDFVNYMKGE